MITSKQRSYLRKLGNSIDAIFQIGKGGLTDELIRQVDMALEAREIVKIHVLNNSAASAAETFDDLASATGAEKVQIIGNKFILYRPNKKEPVIKLP